MKSVLVLIVLLSSVTSWAANDFLSLFQQKKPIIAALMVDGQLDSQEKIDKATRWSLEQLKIAEDNNMDGILFEFRGGEILSPKISKAHYRGMVEVAKKFVAAAKKVTVGVEILWHYPEETLQLAKDSGAKFVRVDFFSDEVIADGKKVPLDPQGLITFRKKIGADNIALLTDIQVKYSEMINKKITLTESATKAESKGSDGVIVSGSKSGSAPSSERPRLAKQGAKKIPVVIGSGFSVTNADDLLKYADAVIVGTSISVKTGGPLLPDKVQALMAKVNKVRQQPTKRR